MRKPELRTMYGVELMFERRKYGTGSNTKFCTWLYWKDANGDWKAFGDPWPSAIIPKAQLEQAVIDIKARV